MGLIKDLLIQTEKIDFLFPNSFEELMNNDYYDYDKFEWFLYYVFKLDGSKVEKIGSKGKGDGGADLILTLPQNDGGVRRIGIQAKYWKNKVGTEPINQLASAQSRHNLTDLWIITTSDLTSDAKKIADSMDIKILRADKVSDFILSIKERHDNDIKKSGNSSIEFLKTVIETPLETKFRIDELIGTLNLNHVDALKNLRIELSKKYKLLPLYNVFNNEMLSQIIIQKPISIDALSQIKGFGTKKIELFGAEIIDFVNNNLINSNKTNNDSDEKLMELLLIERVKIAKFNKITENDVFDDKVANRIAKMKPQNKETLSKVYGFKKENINIFGDYLIRVITKYLESINK